MNQDKHSHVILQDKFPFEYSYYKRTTTAVLEYSKMLDLLNLSSIQRYQFDAWPDGYDNQSIIIAFISFYAFKAINRFLNWAEK